MSRTISMKWTTGKIWGTEFLRIKLFAMNTCTQRHAFIPHVKNPFKVQVCTGIEFFINQFSCSSLTFQTIDYSCRFMLKTTTETTKVMVGLLFLDISNATLLNQQSTFDGK